MRWIVIGLLAPLVCASATLADEIVTEDQVVRSGPSPRFRIVARLSRGTQVEVIGEESFNYLPIQFTGGRGRGWVVTSSVRREDDPSEERDDPSEESRDRSETPETERPLVETPRGPVSERPAKDKSVRERWAPNLERPRGPAPVRGTLPSPSSPKRTTRPIRKAPTRRRSIRRSRKTPRRTSPSRRPVKRSAKKGRITQEVSGSAAMVNQRLKIVSNAIVREGPGRQYRMTGIIFPPAKVQVSSVFNGWCVVTQDNGLTGFVEAACLEPSSRLGRVERAATTGVALDKSRLNGGLNPELPGRPGGASPPGAGTEPRSRAGFIQLKRSGSGYYCYSPSSGQWGRPRLIYAIMRVGRRLKAGGLPRLGVGDISLKNGGAFRPHKSHRRGLDVDCRLMYSDRSERAGTVSDRKYSPAWTAVAIRLFREEIKVRQVLFNDRSMIKAGLTRKAPGHHNHFHVSAR